MPVRQESGKLGTQASVRYPYGTWVQGCSYLYHGFVSRYYGFLYTVIPYKLFP